MGEGYKLYNYNPSTGAAVSFAAVFGLTTAVHIWQLLRNRTWFFIPFVIGSLFETFGYLSKYFSAKQTPDWETMPYVGQSLLLLLAPAFFAASIYMILGRIIRLLNASSNSMIRPNWLTKIFVTGDVLSFLIQSGGGGMLAKAMSESCLKMGENMIIGGFIVQLLFFGFFIVVSVVFHRRMLSTPLHFLTATRVPWTRYMMVLYVASALIMIRSIYRVAEYVQGTTGYLQSHEAFIYVFDAALVFICCVLFNIFHPSELLSSSTEVVENDDLEMMNHRAYKSFP
ncbi:RTA1 domain protein [Penicillium capsulatum]|uniref:RTA1 domain protein n=1 Tax=Penicillium capsulatum TaxID=69766 RepID=A0A9W9ISS1_9EURO|nr:RTA1 domain protein [Penicillium capsulatum]KAJ6130008.1 RTA1 domain protein [Penicillium capsulatum]